MSLASIIAKKIANSTGDFLDAKLVERTIKPNTETMIAKHGLIDEGGKENVEKINYVVEKVDQLLNKETVTDNDFVDPDATLVLDIEERILNNNPQIERALRRKNYFNLEDQKTADIDDSDNGLLDFVKYRLGRAPGAEFINKALFEEKATQAAKILKATPEYSVAKTFNPPTKINYNDTIPPVEDVDEALTEFLMDSVVQEPVFRGVKSGAYAEYDSRFFTPDEIGVHVGSEGQANYFGIMGDFGASAGPALNISEIVSSRLASDSAEMASRRLSPYDTMEMDDAAIMSFADEVSRVVNKTYTREEAAYLYRLFEDGRKKVSKKAVKTYGELIDDLRSQGATKPQATLVASKIFTEEQNPTVIYKGYINVKNPLDLAMDDGQWKGADIFRVYDPKVSNKARIDTIVEAIAEQATVDVEDIVEQTDFQNIARMIDELDMTTSSLSAGNKKDFISDMRLTFKEAEISHAIREWIESYGFDSIHYYNAFEPSFPEETASSYIIFRPEQFKSVFAKRFDQEDPRFGAAEGGLIGRFFEDFMARNQEIKQEDTRRVVKQGDTLSKIAKEAGLTVEELQEYNKIKDKNKIQAGESLRTQPPVDKNQVLANVGSFLNPFAGDKTAEDYDSAVVEEIRKAAKNAIAAGRMNIDYEDYEGADVRGQASSPEKREETSFVRRMITGQATPTEEAAFSVGGATLVVEDDNVYATDVYDFSSIPREKVKDAYSAIRYIVGEIPGNEFKSKIYLGKADEFGIRKGKAKGGKVSKKDMACNKPKRTPQHPKKSHVVKACEGGKEKVIRFGEQGAKTAGKPKAGESERMKKKRKSFKARHAKNIKKGKMSAAYWADKVKW